MSHRMCAGCKNVIDNGVSNKMECPSCGSLEMCSPDEHNDEWAMIYKLQTQVMCLEAEKGDLYKCMDRSHERLSGKNGWTNNVVQDVMLELRECLEKTDEETIFSRKNK